jgi:RimJ/RimL family protein N-acetyltransferase
MLSVMQRHEPDDRLSFRSARLRGEPVEQRHAAEMVQVLRDPLVFRYLSGDPPTLAALEERYRLLTSGKSPDGSQHWLTWILVERASGRAVGFTQASVQPGSHFHVAYVVGRDHWRQGYAREAVSAMLDAVFEHFRVDRAIIEVDTRNAPSIALAESLGFRRTETRPSDAHDEDTGIIDHVYELLRDEWSAR